jgi:2-dehydro-3-deoxygalactonokinase
VPCQPVGDQGIKPAAFDQRLDVTILPGLSQSDPADVMRGEETQIAGFLSQSPNFDGVICLPGTHTKWVQVSAGEVVSFRTFMTGEMFDLMSGTSVLRFSMDESWHEDSFAEAVRDSMSHPHMMASRFFSLRAESLLGTPVPGTARARLSGLLIGSELAAARPYWLGQNVVVLGEGTLAGLYAIALEGEGVAPEVVEVSGVTLAGLTAAYQKIRET